MPDKSHGRGKGEIKKWRDYLREGEVEEVGELEELSLKLKMERIAVTSRLEQIKNRCHARKHLESQRLKKGTQ